MADVLLTAQSFTSSKVSREPAVRNSRGWQKGTKSSHNIQAPLGGVDTQHFDTPSPGLDLGQGLQLPSVTVALLSFSNRNKPDDGYFSVQAETGCGENRASDVVPVMPLFRRTELGAFGRKKLSDLTKFLLAPPAN